VSPVPDVRGSGPNVNFLFSFMFKKLVPDILDNFFRPLLVLDRELKVQWANRRFYALFKTAPREVEGCLLSRIGDGEWDIPGLAGSLKQISFRQSRVNDWEVSRYFERIGQRTMLLNARQIDSHRTDSHSYLLLAIEDVTGRRREESELQKLSFTDELTNLHNRRSFIALTIDRLKQARRAKADSCLFFADVDSLKQINDTLGHAAGDAALVDVAGILRETFRESDIVARFSGDEFVAFMSPAVEGSESLVAERLKKNLARLNLRQGYKLSLSMGACHLRTDDLSPLAEVMERADEKLQELKKTRKILFSGAEPPFAGDYSKDE
jgi:diguanylate cyclase (GGDEF)-like protein